MTLIVALRCHEGLVICADSQETGGPGGSYRVTVEKVKPIKCGNFELVLAGSCIDADLADAFTERIYDNLSGSPIITLPKFKKFMESELLEFGTTEASIYPRAWRRMNFVVCARTLTAPYECEMWKTKATRLVRLDTHDLIGWNEPMFKQEAARLFYSDLPVLQGIAVGLSLLAQAEGTANYVRSPFTVLTASATGMWVEKAGWVQHLLDRWRVFDSEIRRLALACPDTGMSQREFAAKLEEFRQTVVHLRTEYREDAYRRHIARLGDLKRYEGFPFPYPEVPPGRATVNLADGSIEVFESEEATPSASEKSEDSQ